MKKTVKIIVIILGVLILLLLIDTTQAKVFDNKPIIKVVEDYNGGNLYQKHKGVLVDTYVYTDGEQKTVFKWEKYSYHLQDQSGTNPEFIFTDNDITVSYANWAESNKIFSQSLNINKMIYSNIQWLPIYKFDTLTELENFKNNVKDIWSIDSGYDEVPSFNESTAKYNENFFEENTLMLVYVEATSGSYRYGVNNIYCDGTSFHIHIEQTNNPEIHSDDMSGWFITVAVPDSIIENCTEFDADLNNIEK